MTKTLTSLAHREHKVFCTKHQIVAIVPSEALAIWMAGEHVGKYAECKGKVSYYPTTAITKEGAQKSGINEGGSGEIKG